MRRRLLYLSQCDKVVALPHKRDRLVLISENDVRTGHRVEWQYVGHQSQHPREYILYHSEVVINHCYQDRSLEPRRYREFLLNLILDQVKLPMYLRFFHVTVKSLDIRDHALVLLNRLQSLPLLKIIPFFLNPVSHNLLIFLVMQGH